MKRCDKVMALGYPVWEEDEKEPIMTVPDWLPSGRHTISIMKFVPHGIMVKTDRLPEWININWFVPVL